MPLPVPHRGGMREPVRVERAQNTRRTVARLWGYLRRQRGALILTGVMVACTALLDLAGPMLLGLAIDRHIMPRNLQGLPAFLLLMLAVYATSAGLGLLQNWVMAGAAQRTIRDLRADLFSRLQKLPLRFFDQRLQGDLLARLTSDVESVNQALSSGVTQLVSGVVSTVGVAIAMFWLNPLMAAVTIGTLSVFSLMINRWMGSRIRTRFRLQQAALGSLYSCAEETFGGQKVIKAYGQEAVVCAKFDTANHDYRDHGIRAQFFSGMVGPLMNTANNLGLLVVAVTGGVLAVRGLTSVGTIATFLNYTRQFGRPLNEIANLYNVLQTALAGAERVFEVIDEPAEQDAAQTASMRSIRGEVVFDQVCFAYRPGTRVLDKVNLEAKPGEMIALIGPTGAGKTTIVNLLTRFYEVESGRVLIDGVDLCDLPKAQLRRQIGLVLQDTFLFAGSVMENIRYGRLEATDEEVKAAAKLANADAFIHRLPDGYDSKLTERGSNLSHGQRQMLSIARAILADPAILILDEATSSVDTRTEKHIQEAMLRLMKGRTSFVIAHRLSTIRSANQILVVNQGTIQERGTHAELLEQKGFYWRLCQSGEALLGLPRILQA